MTKENKQSGVALLSAVLLTTVILGIVFTLSAILIPKLKISSDSKKSVTALYAAETGIEWCIYIKNHSDVDAPVMGNNSFYYDAQGGALELADCALIPLKIIGTYNGVTRAFELDFP